MSIGPPERVRVTGPPRRTTSRRTRAHEIDDQTLLGAVMIQSLLRAQLRLAVLTLAPLFAFAVALPLTFHLFPRFSDLRVAGVPVAILLLGVLIYPVLVLLGWSYVRRAERHERDFAELVEIAES
ncbi:hypothetical protein [Nocardioides sp. Root140]|uniref:hypothetical protein n=1 Tax=Nocardioides sp. Root140 TaxID=1736460 RepID=UPI0006FBD1F6|nr:hypothetical protein [Nocardioides sp. Root140]KQY62687.1 hypothetical protein ASD30_23555 [Nocardioides sp. Root140]